MCITEKLICQSLYIQFNSFTEILLFSLVKNDLGYYKMITYLIFLVLKISAKESVSESLNQHLAISTLQVNVQKL